MAISRNKQQEIDISMAILGFTEILSELVSKPNYLKNLIVDANALTEQEQKKYDDAAIVVQNAKKIKEDADAKLKQASDALEQAKILSEQNKITAKEVEKLKFEANKLHEEASARNTESSKLNTENIALKKELESKISDANKKLMLAQQTLDNANKIDAEIKERALKIKQLAADGI
jgi:hypothetical protein